MAEAELQEKPSASPREEEVEDHPFAPTPGEGSGPEGVGIQIDQEEDEAASDVDLPSLAVFPTALHPERETPQCIAGCCSCCKCCWTCCRTWPLASIAWMLLFETGSGWAISSARRITHVSGLTDLQKMVNTYFTIAQIVMFYALGFAVLSTGKCGEKLANFTGDVLYGKKPCCNFQSEHTYWSRMCCAWSLWGSCCLLQWSGAIVIYGIIIAIALLIYGSGMVVGVMWLVYAVCTGTVSALSSLCPVLYLGSVHGRDLGTHIDYTHACTCSGTASSVDGSCSTGWTVTTELVDTCDDLNDISLGATSFGFALMVVLAAMVGMFAVALRNRQRIGSLLDAKRDEYRLKKRSREIAPDHQKQFASIGEDPNVSAKSDIN